MNKKIDRNLSKYKFLGMIIALVIVFIGFAINVYAENVDTTNTEQEFQKSGIFNEKYTEGVYKLSEDHTPSYLPLICYSMDRILIDQKMERPAIFISGKAIEINEETKGLQALLSMESVRINAPVEYGIIASNGNVVIDADITNTTIIFANGTVTVTEKANLKGDLICYANSLELKGNVTGSILGSIANINIAGKVQKDLRVQTNALTIQGKDNIENGIYLETANQQLNIKDSYPNAVINIVQESNNTITSLPVILTGVTTCLAFTLIFLLLQRLSKKQLFENLKIRTQKYAVFTILSGAVAILLMPVIVLLLVVLIIFGLSMIAIPALIIYLSGIVVIGMLSLLLVGGTIYCYMKERFFKESGVGTDILGMFGTLASLYVLSKLPVVGEYISIAISMIAVGMVMTTLLKRNKKETMIKK